MTLIGPFTTYMQYLHEEEYPALLDDEQVDHYSDWLSRLDREDIVSYAKFWVTTYQDVSWEEVALSLANEFIRDNHLNV